LVVELHIVELYHRAHPLLHCQIAVIRVKRNPAKIGSLRSVRDDRCGKPTPQHSGQINQPLLAPEGPIAESSSVLPIDVDSVQVIAGHIVCQFQSTGSGIQSHRGGILGGSKSTDHHSNSIAVVDPFDIGTHLRISGAKHARPKVSCRLVPEESSIQRPISTRPKSETDKVVPMTRGIPRQANRSRYPPRRTPVCDSVDVGEPHRVVDRRHRTGYNDIGCLSDREC